MNMNCTTQKFRVKPGQNVDLRKWPTKVAPLYRSKKHYRKLLEEYREEISKLQDVLYAFDRYALLLVFQGMDAAGKDGAIKHVMSGINPQGCQVYSFKQPTSEELDHDYLWRTNKALPERGRIGIFNRSYYEEVLVAKVNPAILQNQRLPSELVDLKRIWRQRYRAIVNLESYLHHNGTRIVKFFLHVSNEEQRRRLLARIDDPRKNWKMNLGDMEVRRQWNDFQAAYEDCLKATSSRHAPWYVVPADDKSNARLIISHIILETMKSLRMSFPVATKQQQKELALAKKLLSQN